MPGKFRRAGNVAETTAEKPCGTGLAFTVGNAKRQPISNIVGHHTGGP